MKSVLVFAVHPDDETLGCGGTLLKHKKNGDKIHWLIATQMTAERGFSKRKIDQRKQEIKIVSEMYGFDSVHYLNLDTTCCDQYAICDLVSRCADIINLVQPTILYLPFNGDVHSDHRVCFDAVYSCTKSFRYPSLKKIFMMETLSETDFAIPTANNFFIPNVYVDIFNFIEQKIQIMSVYKSEFGVHPFPRSAETIKSLARVRGAASGLEFSESFMLIKEVVS